MRVEVTAKNVGPTVFSANIRGYEVKADVPEAMGGTDTAPLPPEIFAAALASVSGWWRLSTASSAAYPTRA